MRLDSIKEKKELVALVLLGVSAFAATMIVLVVIGFFCASARAEKVAQSAGTDNSWAAKQLQAQLSKAKTVAEELKKKNLFAPPPPKQHPVREVRGILGAEVLIADKWYKLGDMVGDAKIVAIEPTLARIEWDGKTTTFAPISAPSPAEATASGGGRRPLDKLRAGSAEKEMPGRQQEKVTAVDVAQPPQPPPPQVTPAMPPEPGTVIMVEGAEGTTPAKVNVTVSNESIQRAPDGGVFISIQKRE